MESGTNVEPAPIPAVARHLMVVVFTAIAMVMMYMGDDRGVTLNQQYPTAVAITTILMALLVCIYVILVIMQRARTR